MRGRQRGSLEQEVLACLSAADEPLTVAQVQAELDSALAYTTVMTTLARLHAKRAVTREPDGRAYRYALADGPDGARASMTAHHMHRLLEDTGDRAGVLAKFVGELGPEDERVLRRLLAPRPRRSRPPA